jgi:hypothetical protein
MSNLPIPSAIIRNNDNDDQQKIITTTSRITSLPYLQQKQHHERITANNLACDETHDLTSKNSLSMKRNNDESNTKTRRLQSITNNNNTQNNYRTHTAVDSFVQLNLTPAIDIKLEDYKKARDTMPTTKTSSNINRSSNPQSIDMNESNQQSIIKKSKMSSINKSHEDASFGYFPGTDDNIRQHSRSSSSSSSTNQKNDLSINQTLSQSNTFEHSKLIANNDFDSHGSSIATKSSSENSGSARTGSGSDSDDEHHQSSKQSISSTMKSSQFFRNKSFNNYDDTPTIVLNETSENRTSQHDRISSLPDQHSYELVKLNTTDEPPSLRQVPRFKQPATDDPTGLHNSTHDSPPYPTQRSQQNHLSSSSHQNRNPERHDQYNTNHSNSSRKSSNRRNKKTKTVTTTRYYSNRINSWSSW